MSWPRVRKNQATSSNICVSLGFGFWKNAKVVLPFVWLTNRRDGMTFKTILTAAALTMATAAGAFAMCADKEHAMSCGEGMTYDADSRTCVPQTTS
jgi:hypothetical protein